MTFDEVSLRGRATSDRPCTNDGRFEYYETDRAIATTDYGSRGANGELRTAFLKELERQKSLHKAQMEALLSAVDKTYTVVSTSLQGTTPSFMQFGLSSKLWTDH